MRKRRYIGSIPYDISHKTLFKGRENDYGKLSRLLNVRSLVVLYGKSGVGKTSLINAKLIPKYCEDNDYEPISLRFYYNYSDNRQSESKQIQTPLSIFVDSINQISNNDFLLDKMALPSGILWQALKKLHLTTNQYRNGRFLIVFDQFEEFFSYHKEFIHAFGTQLENLIDKKLTSHLYDEIQIAVESTPGIKDEFEKIKEELFSPIEVKILLSIRSNKLSELNKLKITNPSILDNCYELTPLSKDQAIKIIKEPPLVDDKVFESPTYHFEEAAIEKIVGNLGLNDEETRLGVEAWQLQIVCSDIERRIIQKSILTGKVQAEDIETNFKEIFRKYYENEVLGNIHNNEDLEKARFLIEELLIIDDFRITRDEKDIKREIEINDQLLDYLVEKNIIRREKNNIGNNSYELSHDTLVSSILSVKENRQYSQINQLKKESEVQKKEIKRNQVIIWGGAILLFLIILFSSIMTSKNAELNAKNQQLSVQKDSVKTLNENLKDITFELEQKVTMLEEREDSLRKNAIYITLLNNNIEQTEKEKREQESIRRANSPEGKPATWFSTLERKNAWREGLSDSWKKALDKYMEENFPNKLYEDQIALLMGKPIIELKDNSLTDLSGLTHLTNLIQATIYSTNLDRIRLGYVSGRKLKKINYNSMKLPISEINKYKKINFHHIQ